MTALPDLSIEFVQALLPFIAVGFLAQLVDGALGMAFGLITNLMLVGMVGLAPARASANVHLVECFTTAASAISHIIYRNVDWGLLARLAIPHAWTTLPGVGHDPMATLTALGRARWDFYTEAFASTALP